FFLGFVASPVAQQALLTAYEALPKACSSSRQAALLPARALQLRYAADPAAFPGDVPTDKGVAGVYWACRLLVEPSKPDAKLEQAFVDAVGTTSWDEECFPWGYGRPDKLVSRILLDHAPDG